VPAKSIIKWNHLFNAIKGLQIGQKLIIWQVSKVKASKLKNLTKIGVNVKRTITYRVRAGDNLSAIAHKFGVRVSQLLKWNKLFIKKPLKIGKKLKIIKSIVKQ
jgi:membrane-bound lytic murein transglycosylase D